MNDDEKFFHVVRLIGQLLVARKDVKAIESPKGWMPDRPRPPRGTKAADMPCLPMTMEDFRQHLFGKRCMGTYLLDHENRVKFFALDIDLKTDNALMLNIPDLPAIEQAYATWKDDEEKIVGILDLENTYVGNLEEALHNPDHVGHRWARLMVRDSCEQISKAVVEQLGLHPLCVITGGGAHVLVPLGALTPASEARAMASDVMAATGMELFKGDNFYRPKGNDQAGVEIEVFPKQDTIAASAGFGNLIRLPLGYHAGAGMRTYFLDMNNAGLPWWQLPKAPAIPALEAAAKAVGIEVK